MTTRILALYDRSPLGDLAVETAFQFARGCDAAALVVLAVSGIPVEAKQREVLHDDLLLFVHLGQRLGIAVDGEVIDAPNAERLSLEMLRWRVDHAVIVEPAAKDGESAMQRMRDLDAAAGATGVTTIVVREESP
ncbi:hypothetical protein ASG87_05650 [Frateuria sp. Soil773]|uniref:hypothetical protein n=1 Tax=Frateuria sp. Soil773 TaxID=1736407 RepID=UPI00070238E8|nr:hypothetical protein [Frateuria sp. Soil773]KRE89031.1 hypothetical protein ASG87_05650 [Frateuria sp. Soil773]